jgi:hypothetical protein
MDSLCKTAETAAASSPAVMTDASTGPTGTSLPPAGPAGTLPTPTGPTGTSPTRPTGRTRATPHSSGTRSPSEVAAAVVGAAVAAALGVTTTKDPPPLLTRLQPLPSDRDEEVMKTTCNVVFSI